LVDEEKLCSMTDCFKRAFLLLSLFFLLQVELHGDILLHLERFEVNVPDAFLMFGESARAKRSVSAYP
jgi:hypothetical protein